MDIVKGKRTRYNGKRLLSQSSTLEIPSACTITFSRKYITTLIPPIPELMPSTEVRIAHVDAEMQPLQCYNQFPALAIVCGLLAVALQNKMVNPVDKEAFNISRRFLVEKLVTVQSLALREG